MRTANMGELLQKHCELQESSDSLAITKKTSALRSPVKTLITSTALLPTSPKKETAPPEIVAVIKKPSANTRSTRVPAGKPSTTARAMSSTRARAVKRTSDIMIAADHPTDQENEELENPKKRTKTTGAAGVGPSAASKRVPNASTILSPKSNNSRTLPQSPVRPPFGVPAKGFTSRPASPLKPAIVNASPVRVVTVMKAAVAAAPTRATRGKAAAVTKAIGAKAETRTVSGSSNASTGTTGTTVVRRTTARAPATGSKTTAATANKRAPAAKAKTEKAAAEAGAGTGTRRVLRKRTGV